MEVAVVQGRILLEESGLESSQTGERCERLEDPLEYLEDLVRFW